MSQTLMWTCSGTSEKEDWATEPAAKLHCERQGSSRSNSFSRHAYIRRACRRRTWGNNEIGREDYWRRLCPVKALTERIPPSAAQRDRITSSLTLRMVQSKFQQCRLHINYMVLRSKEPVSIQHGKDFGRKLEEPHALLTLATGTGETRKLYRSETNNLSPSF